MRVDGGSGAGASNGASGGGSGGGILIHASSISMAGLLSARGGQGGGGGCCGDGGGGGGGRVYIDYGILTITGTVDVSGGTSGTAGLGHGMVSPMPTGGSGTVTQQQGLLDLPLTETVFSPPSATEGADFASVTVFSFTDADPSGIPSDFTATVTLGNGTTLNSTMNPRNVPVVPTAAPST